MELNTCNDISKKITNKICVIGHPFAPIGMGEHLRTVCRSFATIGASFSVVDIFPQENNEKKYREEFADQLADTISDGINIFCINGDEVQQCKKTLEGRGVAKGYSIIYPAWELERYPVEWAKQLDTFDEIWASSKFTFNSLSKAVVKPVYHLPLSCEVHRNEFHTRRYFSIPESSYVYLFCFDFLSYLERKNPFSVLEAFRLFLQRNPWSDAILLVKTNNHAKCPKAYKDFLEATSSINNRVVLLHQTLSDGEMKSLISLCDCFVSLHRSEGFGFSVAEAMYLEKPVIVTGYSGNMDFCKKDNALLVNYDLIPVGADEYPHWQDQVWADADVTQTADFMTQLLENKDMGRKLGLLGKMELLKNFSYKASGIRYLERIFQISEQ